jgi:nitrite reductase/ring-hydroxylating ferredoxin subunit/uncharacterized membrane protein
MASPVITHSYPASQSEQRNRRLDVVGRRFVRWWEDQPALDKLGEKLSGIVQERAQKLPGGQKTVDFLNGTFLGHPLHPVLTDLPIGAFSFAALFDAATIGRKRPSKAATTLMLVGLASVPPTAIAGLLDWQHTYGKTKRVGLGHATMNTLGSVCFVLSLLTRLRGRGPTRMLNFAGNGILMASAYMGGHLVYESRVGVKHESESMPPEHFVPVMPEAQLQEQQLKRAEANGYPIALYKRFGQVYAIADVCPHLGCSLSEGSVNGDAVVCGCHSSTFALASGAVLRGPSAFPAEVYATRVVNGTIEVAPIEGLDR